MEFHAGVSCPGVVVQGGIIQGKMFEGQKSRQLPCGEFHEGNCPGVNYSGVIVWQKKVRGGLLSWGKFHRGKLCGG